MPVAYSVGWVPVARRKLVSSTPIADTPSSRFGSSTSGAPRSMTWVMIVCQATPSCAATRATARSWKPTCSKAHCRARSVSTARGAIASCSSVQVLFSHNAYRHAKTRLRQRSSTGVSAIGRSRTSTVRRSFTRATAPHTAQPTRSRGSLDQDMPFTG